MATAYVNPDWIHLEMPEGPFGEIFAEAFRRIEENLLVEDAPYDVRRIASDAYLLGVKTAYEMLRQMRVGETPEYPFEMAFEAMGKDIATTSRNCLDS
jgi:hypothetical protein